MFKSITYCIIIIPLISAFFLSCHSYNIKEKYRDGNSLLHEVILKRDIVLVKKVIDDGADINCANDYGITPIRLAAFLKEKEMVRLLIEKGIRVNYNKNDNRSKIPVLFRNNILKYPEKKKNFFLTFDAGADDTNLNYILNLLKKYRITATFFVTGDFLIKYPLDAKRIVADGHVVGNHTFTHSFNYNNEDELINELHETEYTFKKITGKELTRIWRAPYLHHLGQPWMLDAARKIGYRHVDVSLYSRDWVGERNSLYLSNSKFINLFENRLDFTNIDRIDADGSNYFKFRKKNTDFNGIIMLMHTGTYRKKGNDFVYTLEDVILQLISSGYLFDNCRKFED